MTMTSTDLGRCFPELTRHMSPEQLSILFGYLEATTFKAGERIITDGEPCSTMYLVAKGRLSVLIKINQEALTLGTVGPGAWVGEIGLIDPGPACATVEAVEDTVLLSMSADALTNLVANHPIIASLMLQKLLKELASRLRASDKLLLDVVTGDEQEPAVSLPKRRWVRLLAKQLTGARGN